ncbi:hypothetical protein GCM10027589_39250 [Actinocorallia lasiicapitis]
MEPITLAAAAVTALAPYLGQIAGGSLARIGEAASDGAAQRVTELYRTIRGRVTGHPYEEATLDRAEAEPDSESRLAALRGVLTELLESDPAFARELAPLITHHLQVADSGAVAGNDFHQTGTYVAGRDLHIGDV